MAAAPTATTLPMDRASLPAAPVEGVEVGADVVVEPPVAEVVVLLLPWVADADVDDDSTAEEDRVLRVVAEAVLEVALLVVLVDLAVLDLVVEEELLSLPSFTTLMLCQLPLRSV